MKMFFAAAAAAMLLTVCVSANDNCLMYYDFEGISDNAETYISDTSGITTSCTNAGLKNYDFIFENKSTRLCFTAYKSGEIDGNGSRKFIFTFPEYSLEKYPGTKLVLGYDEVVYERADGNYTHVVTADNSGKQMSQLFAFPKGDTDNMRMMNKDIANVPRGTVNKYKMTADMNTKKFIFAVGESFSKEYDFQHDVSSLSKITWTPTKNEKYSIDNIYAWAVPNTFAVSDYTKKISVSDKKISVYLTAPADDATLDKISVNGRKNGFLITQNFKKAEIEITLNSASYGEEYTLSFEKGFKDIAGNEMTGEIKTETESFPKFDITSSYEHMGNDIKYLIYAENPSEADAEAYIIAGLYDENGILSQCAFFEGTFAPGQRHGFEGTFKNCTNSNIKAYAAAKGGAE